MCMCWWIQILDARYYPYLREIEEQYEELRNSYSKEAK